jgi:polyisoprenoid-binding protein YceI
VSAAGRYRFDPRASRLTVRAFAGGPLSAIGHNPSFAVREVSGEVALDPGAPSGSLAVSIRADSLALTDSVSERDRQEIERAMREDALETARYPEIVYQADEGRTRITSAGDGQFQVALDGDLTLHGVTRRHPLSARVFLTGDLLRGSTETSVRQSDFGIKLVQAAGGMIKVKEDVKLTFDFVARKQD